MKKIINTEHDRKSMIEVLTNWDISKKPAVFNLKRLTAKRSSDQNSLMWVWLSAIEIETGNNKHDLHEYFKDKYCPIREVEVMGNKQEIRSTKLLNDLEFTMYLEKIKVEMREFCGLELLSINDPLYSYFYEQYTE